MADEIYGVTVRSNFKTQSKKIGALEGRALRTAFKRIGPALERILRAASPTDTGRLASSWASPRTPKGKPTAKSRKGTLKLRVATKGAGYGQFVELGTKRRPATWFARQAFNREESNMLEVVVAELNRTGVELSKGATDNMREIR